MAEIVFAKEVDGMRPYVQEDDGANFPCVRGISILFHIQEIDSTTLHEGRQLLEICDHMLTGKVGIS